MKAENLSVDSDQKKKDIKYKNTQNTSQKTQDSTTRTPLKSGVDLGALKRYYRNWLGIVTQKLPSWPVDRRLTLPSWCLDLKRLIDIEKVDMVDDSYTCSFNELVSACF